MTKNPITVSVSVKAKIDKAWEYWNKPELVSKWAFASDDWAAEGLENDLRVGGKFRTLMFAKDKSFSFEFGGVYSAVIENELIEYDMDDGRHVKVEFKPNNSGVDVIETFDPESQNPREMQEAGWQAILDNYKKCVELSGE